MRGAPSPSLSIRSVTVSDAELINQYWSACSEEDLERMGELGWPDPDENLAFLRNFCSGSPDPEEEGEDIRVWCVDDVPIGYSTLKEFKFGGEGQVHLHIWDRGCRGKGYGSVLFCLTALDFIKKFQLRSLFCQPKRDNAMPNGMLRKMGFLELEPVEYLRRDGSSITQSRFHIEASKASEFLASRGTTAS